MSLYTLSATDKLVLAVVAAVLFGVSRVRAARRRARHPPGPPGRFFFGNFFDFPKKKAYKGFKEMGKRYDSDILWLESFGQKILVLNSHQAVNDLLEKRSIIYSSRASQPVTEATLWPTWNMAFSQYNQHWKDMRKLGADYMKEEYVVHYRPVQIAKSVELLNNLLHTPEDWQHHIDTESAGTMMDVLYGYDVAPHNDPFVSLVHNAMRTLSDSTSYPGSDVFNELPLQRLPDWVPFKKLLMETARLSANLGGIPFRTVQKEMREGKARPSMVSDLLAKHEGGSEETMTAIRDLAGSFYAGGSDTSASIITSFVNVMAAYPEWQKRVHDELDAVVGTNRLPEFPADRPHLPVLEAVLREATRCICVVPVLLGHVTTRDDEYRGFYIPKGTSVVANNWALDHDDALYPDPLKFDPTRFLTKDNQFHADTALTDTPMFGHGRRKCPGRNMAEPTLWISIAYLMATFNMKPANPKEPNLDVDRLDYVEGVVYQAKPFNCTFTVRSEKARALIEEARHH